MTNPDPSLIGQSIDDAGHRIGAVLAEARGMVDEPGLRVPLQAHDLFKSLLVLRSFYTPIIEGGLHNVVRQSGLVDGYRTSSKPFLPQQLNAVLRLKAV